MKRKNRLTRSNEFKRVRQSGKSFAHPLIVLIVENSQQSEAIRVGVSAGRSIGSAVERNRAKRLMREAMHPLIPNVYPGSYLILLARKSLLNADYAQIQTALLQLLQRAKLLKSTDDQNDPA